MGVAFNVKLFEALAVLPALGLLAVLASDLPARRRAGAIAGGLVALAGVGVAWVTAASLSPLSARPWPIGSTDGSVWSVVFGYNGVDRLRSTASAAALKFDPPGALRFLSTTGHDYASLVGTTLLAAIVFGAIALGGAASARPAREGGRLALAGAAFLGLWLVVGVAGLSAMQRFEPRYLEAVDPAIAAVLGIGVGWLATRGAQRRAAAVALAAGAGVAATAAVALEHPPAWATIAAAAGAAGCAAAAAGRRTTQLLAGCALVAALAVPAASALTVVRTHVSDSGLAQPLPAAEVDALSRFLVPRQGRARYEVASSTVYRTSQLVVRDGRPVLVLTSVRGRPLLTPGQLAHKVATGQVRYVLLGRGTCTRRPVRPCAPVLHWARAHARDVSRAAGVAPSGTLYRLSQGAVSR
jgi:4-amino-4-deoxy-L-arabinose transferase-like glycosyltransferase